MLSTWSSRDPVSGVIGDFLSDFDPLSTSFGYVPSQFGSRSGRIRSVGRLMTLDAFETDNDFRVIVEVPGVPKDKLEVNVDNFLLTIKATKEQSEEHSKAYNMVRNEVIYGTDTRSVRLPANCQQEPSCCSYRDGVLCISFPKQSGTEIKKLNIEG